MENLGLKDGVIFGGQYFYHPSMPTLLAVPIQVIVYWAIFIFTGISITDSFLIWINKHLPNHKVNPIYSLAPLIILDATIVTIIDLFLDPLQVRLGTWTWVGSGPYFGIPTGNFIGWFLVASMGSIVFRSIQFFYPPNPYRSIDREVNLYPILGYSLLLVSMAANAISLKMFDLLLIGTSLMSLVIIPNILLFARSANLGRGGGNCSSARDL